jgi:hypothetical protein
VISIVGVSVQLNLLTLTFLAYSSVAGLSSENGSDSVRNSHYIMFNDRIIDQ